MEFTDFFRAQNTKLPVALDPSDAKEKTFIVTGSNTGLGYECTKHLVTLGAARVVMAVRNLKSGEDAKSSIEADTVRLDVLSVWHLNMSSYDSVKKFARRVGDELDRVDGVVENAGLVAGEWNLAEGHLATITVNVTATLLLAVLLVPHLQRSAKAYKTNPRIAIVGSNVAFHAQPFLPQLDGEDIFGDLDNQKKWKSQIFGLYPVSKYLLLQAVRELAALAPVSKTGVTINFVNPGLCTTGLARNGSFMVQMQIGLMRLLVARSAEYGSRTLLHGVVAGKDTHGKYVSECQNSDHLVPEWITNEDGQQWRKSIWEQVWQILEEASPGCIDKAISA